MAIKGSLKEASLADVCQLLALGQKTGCLSVADRARFGQIFFDKGRITFSRIVNRRDRLGDMLVREGAVTQAQLNAALEVQSRSQDRKIGQVLVAEGYLSRADLERFMHIHIEDAVYHLFTWSRGSFFFETDQVPEDGDILVSINAETLLLEAARRVDEWSLIEKKIPSFDLIFEIDYVRVQEALSELTAEQQRILPLLDGTRTLAEIVDQTGLTEFEIGKAMFGLIQAGFAARVGKRENELLRGKESEVNERRNLGMAFYRTAMLEEARREFERVLELHATDRHARFFLALITLREHKYRDALRQLKALLEDTGPMFGAFLNMALALRCLGRPLDALLVLNEAEYVRPGRSQVALARGAAYLESGQVQDALASLQEYRNRLGPLERPNELYFYYAGLAKALAKRLKAAAAIAREGLERYPTAPPLLMLAGLIAERNGDYETAETWFRQVIEEDPSLVQSYKSLGDVFYRRGTHDAALEQYDRALQINPELGDDIYAKLGNILYKKRGREAAIRLWNRALELNPRNQLVRNNIEIVQNAS
jgi:tetratricopeptide (TPR) repeat protein